MRNTEPVAKILEERGKIYGDSNNSGDAFFAGVAVLTAVANASDISRPDAFMGHMHMVMFKMLRLMHNPYHQDSYDDLLGYLTLANKALKQRRRKK